MVVGAATQRKRLRRLAQWYNLAQPILLLSKIVTGAGRWFYPVEIDQLPSRFHDAGILRIKPQALVLWVPMCILRVSSHRHTFNATTAVTWALAHVQRATRRLHDLDTVGTPAVAVSYGDLLWDGAALSLQLSTFVPCLGRLNTEADPFKLRWFDGNRPKTKGTIGSYGRLHPREKLCSGAVPGDILAETMRDPVIRDHVAEIAKMEGELVKRATVPRTAG